MRELIYYMNLKYGLHITTWPHCVNVAAGVKGRLYRLMLSGIF